MTTLLRPALLLLLCASPVLAQDTAPDPAPGDAEDIEEGVDLLSEGARRLLRGLMGEVEPRMRELAEALEEWDFQGLSVDDLGAYHPPEMLPNGDIILRRKVPKAVEDPMDDEIEL